MNEQFKWSRFGLLIRNDFIGCYRNYLNVSVVIFIIMVLNAFPAAAFSQLRDNLYYPFFGGMMMLWGTVQASLALNELLDKRLNEGFLLLPASALEKTIARYLNSSIFFTVYILIFTTVSAFVIEGINMLLFGRHNALFNPFDPVAWDAIRLFMVVQPLFFLGGAYFRKVRWFKTVMSIFIICTGLGLLMVISGLIFLSGYDDLYLVFSGEIQNLDWDVNISLFERSATVVKILWYGVMPPFCLFVTWMRVKETQVSHGI